MKKTGWLIYNGGLLTTKFIELHEWYVETAKSNQIDLIPVSNDRLYFSIEDNQLKLTTDLSKPEFILFLDKDIRLAEHLTKLGIPIFNSAEAIAICDNKIAMHQRLADYELPQPLTIFAPMLFPQKKVPDVEFLNYVEAKLAYPLIIKEAYGSFGDQVYLVENRRQLEEKAMELIYRPHLYQAYIEASHGQDIRLHVVGDQVVASMKRVNKTDFRANVTNGGEMFSIEPNQSFIDLAVKASLAVGADFSGVDLLIDVNNEPVVCEVNSNAHIKNIYHQTSVNVATYIFEYILNELNES